MRLFQAFGLLACAALASRASAQLASAQPVASDAEKLAASADHIARMKVSMEQVLGRVEGARSEKDIVKLNCTNEKLAQIKALLKMAGQADVALRAAVASRDPAADSELSKVAIARAKVDTLRGESEQCVGQLAYAVDANTTVEVQQPSNLPEASAALFADHDRLAGTPLPVPPVVRPPPASPGAH